MNSREVKAVNRMNQETKRAPETLSYRRTQMQRERILQTLKERGCRITKQRLTLIDIILEHECSSCKEIFYQASKVDDGIGAATVYRMVNILEEIGAISRKNMYKIMYSEACPLEDACVVTMDDGTSHHLSAQQWNAVVQAGLQACGHLNGRKVTAISVKPCGCGQAECG